MVSTPVQAVRMVGLVQEGMGVRVVPVLALCLFRTTAHRLVEMQGGMHEVRV